MDVRKSDRERESENSEKSKIGREYEREKSGLAIYICFKVLNGPIKKQLKRI